MRNPIRKGRWYRAFVESTGSEMKLTRADAIMSHNARYVMIPEDYVMCEFKVELHTTSASSQQTNACTRYIGTDGAQGVYMPPYANWDWAYVYIYAYKA